MNMKLKLLIGTLIVLEGIALFWRGTIPVSLLFGDGVCARVEQVSRADGGFCLRVYPREAAANFTYLTVAGLPVFPKGWLVENCRTTEPLGQSEVVDFPRLFQLLPRLFRLIRLVLAVAPLVVLVLVWIYMRLWPAVKKKDSPRMFGWVMAFVSALSMPAPVLPALPGLDASWVWFLNHYAFSRVFDEDVVFTYGPLGFLLVPELAWGNVCLALVSNLLFICLFGRLLMRIYRHSSDGRPVAWLLLLTMAFPQGTMEWRWVLLAILHVAWPTVRDDEKRFAERGDFAIAGALVGFLSFVKFSSLVAVCGAQLFCLALVVLQGGRKTRGVVVAYFLTALSVFVCGAVVFFGSWTRLLSWIVGSVQTASGYNLHMVAEKTSLELAIPFVVILFFSRIVGWKRTVLFSPILFCTAKYAWVRQSASPLIYISSALMVLCLVSQPFIRKRVLSFCVSGWLVCAALGVPWLLSGLAGVESVCGLNPVSFLQTVFLPRTMAEMSRRSRRALEEYRIPHKWRERIGDSSVMCFPWGYEPAMADPTLNLVPLPSLQLYSACHPALDERNADFVNGPVAPRFVVLGLSGGCDVINYPRTWAAIFSNYSLIGRNDRYALLARLKQRRPWPQKRVQYDAGRTIAEKLVALAFRLPVEYFERGDLSGRRIRHAYVRGNQGVDFPDEWIAFGIDDVLSVLAGKR